MKKFLNIMAVILLAVISTSCLEHGLEDLETYTGSDITGVGGVYYRYYGTDVIPGSGELQVRQVSLNYGRFSANEEEGTCEFACQLPGNFPQEETANFSMTKLVVVLNLSSAAVITPIDGAPVLGKPGDWSKPNKYVVTAADGSKKTWTVTATLID